MRLKPEQFGYGCSACCNWGNSPQNVRGQTCKWARFEVRPRNISQVQQRNKFRMHQVALSHHWKAPLVEVVRTTGLKGRPKGSVDFGKGRPSIASWFYLLLQLPDYFLPDYDSSMTTFYMTTVFGFTNRHSTDYRQASKTTTRKPLNTF